ncbi:hypothetical protein M432DRAFT_205885 [Thermoascus aurantiacus ATCC 26904]
MQPTSNRDAQIKRHYELQKAHHLAPYILNAGNRPDRIDLESMYDFCHKGCAMYITVPLGPIDGRVEQLLLDMFHHLYGRLGQLTDADLVRGKFPCKFVASWAQTSPREVGDIVAAHRSLCAQISLRERALNDAAGAADPRADPARHALYELHPLFRALLVIMDRPNWKEDEVLLVRTGDDGGLRCGPIDFDPLRFEFYVDDDGDVLRGTFAKVMALVMDLMQKEDDAKAQE